VTDRQTDKQKNIVALAIPALAYSTALVEFSLTSVVNAVSGLLNT